MDNGSASTHDSSTAIHPGAAPFFIPGGPTGVLLIHGYGGSAGDYRSLGQALAARGYTISGMCVAGHGYDLPTLAKAGMNEWRQSVHQAGQQLQSRCAAIIVIGFSFGGLLALDYALEFPQLVKGVITVNTALRYRGAGLLQVPILKLMTLWTPYLAKRGLDPADREHMAEIGSLPKWPINGILGTYRFLSTFVKPRLAKLAASLLVVTSPDDPVVDQGSADELLNRVGSVDKELWVLPQATHRPLRDPTFLPIFVGRVDDFIHHSLASKGNI